MSEHMLLVLITALVNGAVTWGVVTTKMAWLRRDVDLAHERIDRMERHGGERQGGRA